MNNLVMYHNRTLKRIIHLVYICMKQVYQK